jgi:hypothetical protein
MIRNDRAARHWPDRCSTDGRRRLGWSGDSRRRRLANELARRALAFGEGGGWKRGQAGENDDGEKMQECSRSLQAGGKAAQ